MMKKLYHKSFLFVFFILIIQVPVGFTQNQATKTGSIKGFTYMTPEKELTVSLWKCEDSIDFISCFKENYNCSLLMKRLIPKDSTKGFHFDSLPPGYYKVTMEYPMYYSFSSNNIIVIVDSTSIVFGNIEPYRQNDYRIDYDRHKLNYPWYRWIIAPNDTTWSDNILDKMGEWLKWWRAKLDSLR